MRLGVAVTGGQGREQGTDASGGDLETTKLSKALLLVELVGYELSQDLEEPDIALLKRGDRL